MTDTPVNTGQNRTKKPGTFKKGDSRINRKGRPKSFDQLRALAQSIAAEPISEAEKMTRIEALLRVMTSSRNPADRRTFLEYAFGKPKEEVNLSGDVLHKVTFIDDTTGQGNDNQAPGDALKPAGGK